MKDCFKLIPGIVNLVKDGLLVEKGGRSLAFGLTEIRSKNQNHCFVYYELDE